MGYLYLTLAIIFELIGTTYLKYSEGFTKIIPSVITLVTYGVCYYTFAKALQSINLSVAYATWSAVGLIVTALISTFLFKESLTPAGIAALAMITIGVVILNMYGTPIN